MIIRQQRSYAGRLAVPSAFYSHVARAWAAGQDTFEIARALNLAEADVYRVLASFRDRQSARCKVRA